jgi:hypothetical protein
MPCPRAPVSRRSCEVCACCGARLRRAAALHSLTTAGGTHEIAGGVSNRAPCTAFLNLHENVHVGVFLGGQFPNTVTVQFIDGTC